MWGIFVREYARAAYRFNEVVVLHLIENDPEAKCPWTIDEESDSNLTAGIRTFRIRIPPTQPAALRIVRYILATLSTIKTLHSIAFRPVLIHAHIYRAGFPAIFLGKRLQIPVIVSEQSSAFVQRLIKPHHVLLARYVFEKVAMVLPVSRALQNAIAANDIQARFRVIPNVVDTKLFYPSTEFADPSEPRLLFVGNLIPMKGLETLLNALALLPTSLKWKLLVVGDGPERKTYEMETKQLNLSGRVTFLGLLSKGQISTLMRNVQLYVLPSEVETFSVSTAEALASGLPVLITRCGGPEEFVSERVGLTVPVGDIHTLSQGLEYMLTNLHNYTKNFISSYAYDRFNPDKIGGELDELYTQLINEKGV